MDLSPRWKRQTCTSTLAKWWHLTSSSNMNNFSWRDTLCKWLELSIWTYCQARDLTFDLSNFSELPLWCHDLPKRLLQFFRSSDNWGFMIAINSLLDFLIVSKLKDLNLTNQNWLLLLLAQLYLYIQLAIHCLFVRELIWKIWK